MPAYEGRDVDYLEAHGTGTSLGDPIEVQAAAAVYGAGSGCEPPLLIGSVKTNIGHLESAAGVAGLIKVVLSLQHEMLPQHLHFNTPSPHIPWDRLPVRVVDEAIPWQTNGRPRRAGVSSFGFSGTNAHVLLEEAPPEPDGEKRDSTLPADVALASAPVATTNQSACCRCRRVRRRGSRVGAAIRGLAAGHIPTPTSPMCVRCRAGRSHFEHRAALVVDSVEGAGGLLAGLAATGWRPGAGARCLR